MAACRVVLLPLLLVASPCLAVALEMHEQRLIEATSLLRGGIPADEVEVVPPPTEVLHSPQFSSLLQAYEEDIAQERKQGACRLWIDVERFKANKATLDPLRPIPDVSENADLRDSASSTQRTQRRPGEEGHCASLNERFGWTVRKSSGSLEAPISFAVCTESPWFADIEIVKVHEIEETGELNPDNIVLHVKYSPPLPAEFSSQMSSAIPLVSSQILTPSIDDSGGTPRPGERATVFCLEKGKPLIFSKSVENEMDYLEFLPGPWSVEVDLEFYPDVSRSMGVGARLRLRDNVAVTLPPSRLLPFATVGLRPEQWLLLELAELHSHYQRQNRDAEEEADENDSVDLWDKLQREGALEAFSVRQCRLRRGERFGDPVLLDCLPNIKGQDRKELIMNGVDVVRRGVIGLVLAVIPTLGINAAFHSLIRSNDILAQRVEKAATELSLFSIKREWKLALPLEALGKPEGAKKVMDVALQGWTQEQTEVLNEIASEVLQLYAQGGKDRTKHKTEGKITFAESEDKLVVRIPVSKISYRRRRRLGLLFQTDAELVFTFLDRGGNFHPFHKVSRIQGETAVVNATQATLATQGNAQRPQDANAKPVGETTFEAGQPTGKETSGQTGAESAAGETSGQQLEMATASHGVQMKREKEMDVANMARDNPGSTKDNEEESITYLQLLWQKVGEPQHRELKRTAVANIVGDVGLSAAFLLMAYLTAKLMGSINGRTVADMLKERRIRRLAFLRASEIDVTPTHSSDTHAQDATFDGNLHIEDAALAEGVEANGMMKATPEARDWA